MRRTILMLLALLAVPATLAAQVEVGFDSGLSIVNPDNDDDNLTSIEIPVGAVRVGFPFADRFVFEPMASLSRFSVEDFSYTEIEFVPGLVALFGEPDRVRFFVRGELLLNYVSESDADSASQFGFGGAVGLRAPLGEHAFFRLEGGFDAVNENEDEGLDGYKQFRLFVGLSTIIG